MSDDALLSLAILKVNWDRRGHDYVECFVPFIVESLRRRDDDAVSLEDLQSDIYADFTLDIPLTGLRLILNRARRAGYVFKENGILYRNLEKCQELKFHEQQNQVEDAHERVVNALTEYVSHHHSTTWNYQQTSAALYAFIRNNSLRLISVAANGAKCETFTNTTGSDFLVGSYVVHLQNQGPSSQFSDLILLVQGSLLANVLYLDDPGRIRQRFHRTTVYLDTAIIVFGAGFAGPSRAAPMNELIDLLKTHGASIACFEDTYDEIHGILDACATRLRTRQLKTSYGPSMEYFIESGNTASDVELMKAQLRTTIGQLGISIKEFPEHETRYAIDEASLDEHLDQKIRYVNPKAKKHDVQCLSAIARLRKGRSYTAVEKSRAVFVTNNAALAKHGASFFRSSGTPISVPLAMTDYALGNLLWLKSPAAAPDLPTKTLLAQAYAAVNPPDHLWQRYLEETDKLQAQGEIQDDDYHLLRYSLTSKYALMDVTHGDDQAFTEGTVSEVLELSKARVRADLEDQVAQERDARDQAENTIARQSEKESRQRQRIFRKAALTGRGVRCVLSIFVFVGIFLGCLLTFPYDLPSLRDGLGQYVVVGLLGLILALTIFNLFVGMTARSILDSVEQRVTAWVYNKLLSFAGFD